MIFKRLLNLEVFMRSAGASDTCHDVGGTLILCNVYHKFKKTCIVMQHSIFHDIHEKLGETDKNNVLQWGGS